MAEALGHPRLGYYRTRPAARRRRRLHHRAGDLADVRRADRRLAAPSAGWRWAGRRVALVELGPGRGTLMADALRATRGVPGFHAALEPASRRDQRAAARRAAARARRRSIRPGTSASTRCRPGPMLLVANEFFDALPVRQFEKTAQGWRERMVGLAPDGETLMFALAPGATPFARFLPDARRRRAGGDQRSRPRARRRDRRARDARRRLGADRRLRLRRRASAPRCRRCAATRARPSSTSRAKPTSARMSTSPPWPRRHRRRPSGR